MKLSLLPKQKYFNANSSIPIPENLNQNSSAHKNFLLIILYCISCLFSLILGFRFSRIIIFLLFSTPNYTFYTTTLDLRQNQTQRPIAIGRHGINIRDCPHPNPKETIHAYHILDMIQKEQRIQYSVKESRKIIVVTTTYVRRFQRAYMNSLVHSLRLVPYDLTWIVVEAGGVTNETASILSGAHMNYLHVGFNEGQMHVHALRLIKERKMDGIIMFADDSNIYAMELFEEIQKVKWLGSFSIGILNYNFTSWNRTDEKEEDGIMTIQGPTCNASKKLVTFPTKQEWAAFALNSRLLWSDTDGKPEWARDLDDFVLNGKEIESPLDFLQDASFVEPLGACGQTLLVWTLPT